MSERKMRPLVDTQPVDEFGMFTQDELETTVHGARHDLMYVPGWSEMRKERDLQMAEFTQGRISAKDVKALPVNVRLIRRTEGASDKQDGAKLGAATNLGYRPITKEHVGQDWFTAIPPGAREMPDGSIVNAAGDLQYMYCTAPQAAVNAKRKREATDRMVAAAAANVQGGVMDLPGGHFERE